MNCIIFHLYPICLCVQIVFSEGDRLDVEHAPDLPSGRDRQSKQITPCIEVLQVVVLEQELDRKHKVVAQHPAFDALAVGNRGVGFLGGAPAGESR